MNAAQSRPAAEDIEPKTTTFASCQPLQISDRIRTLASIDPLPALNDPEIAMLFAHYVAVLAPWYDLNDPQCTFGTVVAENALQTPLLFRAAIAFSASHWAKVNQSSSELAIAFHAECIAELLRSIALEESSPDDGSHLAATCLLRSYELINTGSNMEHHLLGAYSYAIRDPIDFNMFGMKQAGVWNYLREEITLALIRRRQVRMGRIFDNYVPNYHQLAQTYNYSSYLLAQVINFCFAESATKILPQERQNLWLTLSADLATWKANLPSIFQPYSTATKPGNPFPSLWMLRPWHVAAQQYRAAIEILLTLYEPCPKEGHLTYRSLRFAQDQALYICGLAWTNEDQSARVNAFGPLAFCGTYLDSHSQQKALENLLSEMSLSTAWPVDEIIQNLRAQWT